MSDCDPSPRSARSRAPRLPRRRRDPRQPDRHRSRRSAGASPGATLRARPRDDRRRRAAASANAAPGRRAADAEKVVEAWMPVPHDVRRRVVGPAPRDDGRHADRPLRQPEHRVHRRLARSRRRSCSACAARRATRSTTPRATGSRRTRRGCSSSRSTCVSRRRLRPRRARSAPTASRVPRDPPRRHRTSACSTSRRPTTGCASRSVHPGVTVDEVVGATGFELVVARRRARDAALPTDEELRAASARSSTRNGAARASRGARAA